MTVAAIALTVAAVAVAVAFVWTWIGDQSALRHPGEPALLRRGAVYPPGRSRRRPRRPAASS